MNKLVKLLVYDKSRVRYNLVDPDDVASIVEGNQPEICWLYFKGSRATSDDDGAATIWLPALDVARRLGKEVVESI